MGGGKEALYQKAANLVSSKDLKNGAGDGIQDQIRKKDLSGKALMTSDPDQEAKNNQKEHHLHDLGGNEGDPRGGQAEGMGRKNKGPKMGPCHGFSITATRKETPKTSDAVPQGHAGHKDVRHGDERDLVFFGIDITDDEAGDQPPIKDQSPFPDLDHIQWIFEKAGELGDDVENPGAGDGPEDVIKTQVKDALACNPP